MLMAELEEIAVGKAVARAFGATDIPDWPTWEESGYKQEIGGAMSRFREQALEE